MSALSTRAVIVHPHSTLDARHTITQDGDDVVVSESWHGTEETRYEVRMPLAMLVHVALNTTAEERAEIDARGDWRGVDEKEEAT